MKWVSWPNTRCLLQSSDCTFCTSWITYFIELFLNLAIQILKLLFEFWGRSILSSFVIFMVIVSELNIRRHSSNSTTLDDTLICCHSGSRNEFKELRWHWQHKKSTTGAHSRSCKRQMHQIMIDFELNSPLMPPVKVLCYLYQDSGWQSVSNCLV